MVDVGDLDFQQLKDYLHIVAESPGGRSKVIGLASRAALRSIPQLGLIDSEPEPKKEYLLAAFRAASGAWAASTYPEAALKIGSSVFDAPYAARELLKNIEPLAASVVRSINLVADAASATRTQNNPSGYAALIQNGNRLIDQAALAADLKTLELGFDPVRQPIWLVDQPELDREKWAALKNWMRAAETGWEIWIDWYEARLEGRHVYQELSSNANSRIELARILRLKVRDWKQGPAHVNAKIKAIIERERERDATEKAEREKAAIEGQPPKQVFSSVRAVWKNGLVVNDPTRVGAELEAQSQIAALKAIKEELIEVAAELDREANIDDRPANHMRRTAELIPDSLPSATELNRLIRREATMLGHLETVQEQWPDFLADSYTTLTEGLTEALDRFAERREVRRSDFGAALDGTDSRAAREDLSALTQAMRSNLGSELIDPAVPTTIESIADEIPEDGPLVDLSSRLATVDSFESANNVLKALAEGGDAAGKKELAIEFLDGVIKEVGADALYTGATKGARAFLEKEAEISVQARLVHLHVEASRPWRKQIGDWLVKWSSKLDPRVKPEDDDR